MKRKADMAYAGKMLRKLRGIRTRTGVARELEMPYQTLQSYEDGKREPSGSTKQKLADYYGKPVKEIFFPESNY